MAFENLLITFKRKIGAIKIDGVINESTQRKMRITTNPIENGATISDHIIEEPLRYVMKGTITDTPLGAAAFTELAGSVIDAATGIFGKSESSGTTRSNQAYQELVKLMKARESITVETKLEKYEDLLFESITINTNVSNSNGISFTASFLQPLTVVIARQAVDQDSIDTDENSAAYGNKSNTGFSGTTPASNTDEFTIRNNLG